MPRDVNNSKKRLSCQINVKTVVKSRQNIEDIMKLSVIIINSRAFIPTIVRENIVGPKFKNIQKKVAPYHTKREV